MNEERISNAVNIIKHAIKQKISIKKASVACGFANTYVKNTKAEVYRRYEKGTLEDKLFAQFDAAYKEYQGLKFNNIIGKQSHYIGEQSVHLDESLNYMENKNEAQIEWKSGSNYPNDHIKTLDELIKATKVDLKLWKVKDYSVNKWDVTAIVNNFPQTIQNFQVKARLEKDVQASKEIAIGEMFKEMIKDYQSPILHVLDYLPINSHITETLENNIFEVALFDLHIGKLAWGGETGENYDTKIARERYLNTIRTLIKRANGFEYSKILFPIGSDFFNSDTIYNTTTKGTPQDEDLRWQKTFQVGTRLLVDAINLLKQTSVPIDVIVIPGNHDFERSYYMGEYLVAWFNNDPAVRINNGASPRKYYRFGKVLLGYTHGSEERESALPLLMAGDIESKPLWSETVYHEWHLGHQHRKRKIDYTVLDKNRIVDENLGVTIRYLSSLTGTEEWHHKKGLIGATKAGEAFIWNDEAGLVAHINANLIIE